MIPTTTTPVYLHIVYASQGGTAEEYAKIVAHEAFIHNLYYTFRSIDDLSLEELRTLETSVFLISTTGDGEIPSRMQGLWQALLYRDLSSTYLIGCRRMAIFGLGDSNYEKFNYAAKKFHRRVEQLGVTLLLPRTDGDEQDAHGLDEKFYPWLKALFAHLLPDGFNIMGDQNLYQNYNFDLGDVVIPLSQHSTMECQKLLWPVQVTKNQRITPASHFQDVRHFEFECISSSSPSNEFSPYEPGDVAVLHPHNMNDSVDKLLQRLGWSGDACFRIESKRPELIKILKEMQIPHNGIIQLRQLLKDRLDITRPLSRMALAILARYIKDEDYDDAQLHREKLQELTSMEGYDLYLDYIWRPKRTPLEVLQDFPSIQPPIECIFYLFPPLRPREFSISSAWIQNAGRLSITVAILEYRTRGCPTIPRYGVCSQWLKTLETGTSLSIGIRKGSWPSISSIKQPLILIAGGTGIAPMRALIQYYGSNHPIWLFFGCRYREKDFHYHEEWPCYPNLQVFVLGSRDASIELTNDTKSSLYKQGPQSRRYLSVLLKDHSSLVKKLIIEEGAMVFLAGNNKLPKLIKATLNEILGDEYNELLKGRFFIECW